MIEPSSEDLARRTEDLGQRVVGLTTALIGLNDTVAAQAELLAAEQDKARRARRVQVGVVVSLVVDLLLSGVVISALLRQDEIVNDVLCPLYELLSQSESPRGRDNYPQGPDAYDSAFRRLNAAYATLYCSPR